MRRIGVLVLIFCAGMATPSRAADASALIQGMALYNELACSGCHQDPGALVPRRGPNLSEVSHRLEPQWVRDRLAGKESGRIPHFLDGATESDLDAVLVALGSLGSARPSWRVGRHSNAARGQERYRALGCVACHPIDPTHDPSGAAESREGLVGFPNLRAKYSLVSLTEFLKDPLAVRPDGRMPDFDLDSHDAEDIAGYLWGFEGSDPGLAPQVASYPQADVQKGTRGREILRAARCANCHDGLGLSSEPKVALEPEDAEALRRGPWPCAKDYGLSDAARLALAAIVENLGETPAPKDRALSAIREFRCLACHSRDGVGGPQGAVAALFQGNPDLGDSGRFPPPLTGVGRKLTHAALVDALRGEASLRPYLEARMPNFGPLGSPMAEVFAAADGAVDAAPLEGDVEAGRTLLGSDGGLGCIGCHAWGDRPSLGIPGPDISGLASRWRPDWLREYLIDPAGYRPRTLMPSFWPAGQASNQEILHGDTNAQMDAILAFAAQGQGDPSGYPAQEALAYELIPKEGPIVQRAFLEDVGTEAILVGFPEGVHLAYDAATARPRLLWRGRFFDATSTWFSRFAPFENPLGSVVARWPDSGEGARRFLGYRIESELGVVFIVEQDGARFEDRYVPQNGGLTRSWTGQDGEFSWTHPEEVAVSPLQALRGEAVIYQWEAP